MNFSKEAMGVGFPFINLQNIFGKTIIDIANLGKAKASDLQLKEYSLHQGDVLFVRSSVKLEGVGQASLVPKTLKNTTYSGFIIRFRDKYGLDNNFKKFIFSITPIRKQIISHATNSANKNISQSVLENIKLIIPNKLEQKKIGSFFTQLDNLITLQQRKLKQLDLLKKAMLQQILTTNDYPKIRFRGFTNVWDQRRLEKIAKITTGKLDANAMVKNGKYDFYTSGIKKFKINTAAFEGPAITIAGNGATVGYMHLADGKFNAYQRTYVLNQFTVNRLFLFYSVKKVLPRSIYQSARTGNIPYIVLNMITDLKVNVPKEKEQKKIGELFTEIQAILINQKNRLRCIKDLKQYLLQNIFL